MGSSKEVEIASGVWQVFRWKDSENVREPKPRLQREGGAVSWEHLTSTEDRASAGIRLQKNVGVVTFRRGCHSLLTPSATGSQWCRSPPLQKALPPIRIPCAVAANSSAREPDRRGVRLRVRGRPSVHRRVQPLQRKFLLQL